MLCHQGSDDAQKNSIASSSLEFYEAWAVDKMAIVKESRAPELRAIHNQRKTISLTPPLCFTYFLYYGCIQLKSWLFSEGAKVLILQTLAAN